MSEIDLSVIIPFYNTECRLIKGAIDSVRGQSHIRTEIILVNDGSTASCTEAVEAYIERMQDVTLISGENRGVSAARNRGIAEARGRYITLLDADDRFTEVFFEDLNKLLDEDVDMIFGGTRIVSENETVQDCLDGDVTFYRDPESILKWKPALIGTDHLFEREHWVYLSFGIAAKVIRRELAKSIRVNETLKIGEDCLWNLQLLEQTGSLAVCGRVWYLYTSNPESATHRYNPGIIRETAQALACMREHVDFNNGREQQAYVNRLFIFMFVIAKTAINRNGGELTRKKRREMERTVYTQEPWTDLLRYRQRDDRNRVRILLYRTGTLFLYYRVRHFLGGK